MFLLSVALREQEENIQLWSKVEMVMNYRTVFQIDHRGTYLSICLKGEYSLEMPHLHNTDHTKTMRGRDQRCPFNVFLLINSLAYMRTIAFV